MFDMVKYLKALETHLPLVAHEDRTAGLFGAKWWANFYSAGASVRDMVVVRLRMRSEADAQAFVNWFNNMESGVRTLFLDLARDLDKEFCRAENELGMLRAENKRLREHLAHLHNHTFRDLQTSVEAKVNELFLAALADLRESNRAALHDDDDDAG